MAAASTWTVTGQAADQMIIDTSGNVITGVRVYFLTGAGNRSSVMVPDDQYGTDVVRRLIQTQADKVDAVGALSTMSPGAA